MRKQNSIGTSARKQTGIAAGALVWLACLAVMAHAKPQPTSSPLPPPSAPIARQNTAASYGKLPLVFEQNLGQTASQVKFLAHASGYTLFLTDREAVLRLDVPEPGERSTPRTRSHLADRGMHKRKVAAVTLEVGRSSSSAKIEGLEAQPGHSNYLIGRDRSRWQRNVPMYGQVKYHGVYPGIDAVYYGKGNRLETDYIVAPGSDPNQIALDLKGTKSLRLNSQGDMILGSAAGKLLLHRPNVYQEIDGTRRAIEANYFVRGKNSIGINLGPYDSRHSLVIDPVLDYSTLLGGSGGESGNGIAVDSAGDAYVCGSTGSTDFPVTSGVYQPALKASTATNAFVAELNPTGTALIFATYIGGSVSDSCVGLGVDSTGNAYITGTTSSFDFPVSATPILFQFPSGNLGTTGFFSEISSAGTTLTYSTYLGGNYRDTPAGLALDSSGNAYIAGTTGSTNFPVSTFYGNAYQTFSNSTSNGNGDAVFLSKINTSSSLPGIQGLLYSTYLGGSDSDLGFAVAADSVGNAYVTGEASSSDFPVTVNAFQPLIGGGDNAFVTRFDTTQAGGASLIYSSFLGGSGTNGGQGNAIAADAKFNAYVGGETATANFPTTAGVLQPNQAAPGYIMGFVARFDTSQQTPQNTLVYSTYLGGSDVSGTDVLGITADSFGDAYVTGDTFTGNYPTTLGAPQVSLNGVSNAIVSVFNPTGSALLFSTYLGGSTNDAGNAITIDSSATPNAYVAGTVHSTNFPVTSGAFQTTLDGFTDAFVAKLSPGAAQGVFATPTTLEFGNQGVGTNSTAQTVTLTNNTNSTLSNVAITFTGSNPADFAQSNTCGETSTVEGSLAAFTSCTISVTFTPTIGGAESATMDIADSDATSPQLVTLTGTGTAVGVSPSSLSFGSQTQNTASAPQTATLTNLGTSSLTGIALSFTGANASDFSQTNTCGATSTTTGTLASGGASCTISVTFTPTTQAGESAALSISDSDPSSPQLVTLAGTGTMPVSGVSASPTSLNFGNQSENTASVAQTVTLTNGGTASLTGITLSFTGTNAADFSETDTCASPGGTLATGKSCTISVTFTPTTQAAESANLSIADSDPASPQLVPLSGTGTAPVTAFLVTLSPSSATINAGDSVTVTATVTSENAFSSAVGFAFSGAPGDASITASPSPVTPPANGTATSTITIVTDLKPGASSHPPFWFPFAPQRPLWMWSFLGLLLAVGGAWTLRQRGARRLACGLAMILLIGLASCTGTPSTPKGTYQVRISGVSGSQNFPATFTLTVK